MLPQEFTDQLIKPLKENYKQHLSIERVLGGTLSLQDSYVNLALIKESKEKEKKQLEGDPKNKAQFKDDRLNSFESLYEAKEPLSLDKLFEKQNELQDPKRLLILGRAGIGKTTLCKYISAEWAFEKRWQGKFIAVFRISLRALLNDQSILNQNQSISYIKVVRQYCLTGDDDEKLSSEKLREFVNANSDKCLWILDGYDEIAQTVENNPFKWKGFFEVIWEKGTVIVTSRPHSISDDLKISDRIFHFDRRLENMGFTNENIEAYIKKFVNPTSQAEKLLKTLRANPGLWGIAHIPINLDIICASGITDLGTTTITDLYLKLVATLLARYQKNEEQEKREVTLEKLKDVKRALASLAIYAMTHEMLLVPKNDFEICLQGFSKSICMDVLKIGIIKETADGAIYFIHLTFQEYFAAQKIAEEIEQGKSPKLLNTEKYNLRYQIVWWFVAGSLYRIKKNTGNETPLLRFFDIVQSKPRDLVGVHHAALLIRCLDECNGGEDLKCYDVLMQDVVPWVKEWTQSSKYRSSILQRALSLSPRMTSGKELTKVWLELLQKNKEQKIAILRALTAISWMLDSKVIDFILQAVKDSDSSVRRYALEALPTLVPYFTFEQVQATWELLQIASKDGDEYVRKAAIEALSALAPYFTQKQVIKVLEVLLQDKNDNVRKDAIEMFFAIPHVTSEQVKTLFEALIQAVARESDEYVRETAIKALSTLASNFQPEQVKILLETLLPIVAIEKIPKLVPFLTPEQVKMMWEKLLQDAKDEGSWWWCNRWSITEAFSALASRLTPEQVKTASETLLQNIKVNEEGVQAVTVEAFTALAPRLTPGQVETVFETLLQIASKNIYTGVRRITVEALPALAPYLTQKQVKTLLEMLLQIITKDSDVRVIVFAIEALPALAPHLVFELVTTAWETLLLVITKKNGQHQNSGQYEICMSAEGVFPALIPYLAPNQIKTAWETLQQATSRPELILYVALKSIPTLAPYLTSGLIEVILAMLLEVAECGINDNDILLGANRDIESVFSALIPYLTTKQIESVWEQLQVFAKNKHPWFAIKASMALATRSLETYVANHDYAFPTNILSDLIWRSLMLIWQENKLIFFEGHGCKIIPCKEQDLTGLLTALQDQAKILNLPTTVYQSYLGLTSLGLPKLVQKEEFTPSHEAVKTGDLAKVKDVLKQAPENLNNQYNPERVTPLMLAMQGGYLEIIDYLLEQGAEIQRFDARCETVIHQLINLLEKAEREKTRYEELLPKVRLTTNARTKVNQTYSAEEANSLRTIIKEDSRQKLTTYLTQHPQIDLNRLLVPEQMTPLMLAIKERAVSVVDALIAQGALLNAENLSGQTAENICKDELNLRKTRIQKAPDYIKRLVKLIENRRPNSTLISEALARCYSYRNTPQDAELISTVVGELIGYSELHKDWLNPAVRNTYRMHIQDIVGMRLEHQGEVRTDGNDLLRFLGLRIRLHFELLLQLKKGMQVNLPEGMDPVAVMESMQEELLLNLEILWNQKIRSNLAGAPQAMIKELRTAQCKNILAQLQSLPVGKEYCIQSGYDIINPSDGHCLYVSFVKQPNNRVLIRIDNRWILPGRRDGQKHGKAPWKTQGNPPKIRPYWAGTLAITDAKLLSYIKGTLLALSDQNATQAIERIYDSALGDRSDQEADWPDEVKNWPLHPIQSNQSNNCTMSSHNIGLHVRHKELYNWIINFEKAQIWQEPQNNPVFANPNAHFQPNTGSQAPAPGQNTSTNNVTMDSIPDLMPDLQ